MTQIPNQRHLFDIPEGVAYFNTATMGPMTKASVEAGQKGLARKLHPWTIPDTEFFADTERLRPLLADLIGSDTDGIAFSPSVSYSLATAARNLPLSKDQEILLLEDQFPSNVYTWRQLAKETGATIRTVGVSGGAHGNETLSDALLGAIGPQTGLVACANVRWTDGAILDLAAIGKRCREVGAALVLDLTQSCGALAFDVKDVQPDFVAVAAYKWLLAPYATGFLYVAPQHRNGTPLEQNWITREGSTNFARLIDYTDNYGPGAQRFDMGERSNFALLPAFESAIRTILDWGVGNIQETLGARNAALAEQLAGIGLECPPAAERGAHYLCPRLPDSVPADLTARLKEDGIFVSRRGDRLRITQHLFTSDGDVEHFIARLGHHLAG
ncbi:aminotransferase class V-fold PLP-dependent enzyme [Hyphomonas jannaschiana]|uniref:Class V aminotransferase n=1 Tax=Hyphomonas jannaschiana VP2 TaxID=1280952 RepID=A0A059F8C5_9PROT|nr:aminotransferase class V-fold PLP-dependent enzyme [Hyphomonas jannaschiana]KCZ86849.1 class V aminotransferase [Hyphomonas jannaschiana VP2]